MNTGAGMQVGLCCEHPCISELRQSLDEMSSEYCGLQANSGVWNDIILLYGHIYKSTKFI